MTLRVSEFWHIWAFVGALEAYRIGGTQQLSRHKPPCQTYTFDIELASHG